MWTPFPWALGRSPAFSLSGSGSVAAFKAHQQVANKTKTAREVLSFQPNDMLAQSLKPAFGIRAAKAQAFRQRHLECTISLPRVKISDGKLEPAKLPATSRRPATKP